MPEILLPNLLPNWSKIPNLVPNFGAHLYTVQQRKESHFSWEKPQLSLNLPGRSVVVTRLNGVKEFYLA